MKMKIRAKKNLQFPIKRVSQSTKSQDFFIIQVRTTNGSLRFTQNKRGFSKLINDYK